MPRRAFSLGVRSSEFALPSRARLPGLQATRLRRAVSWPGRPALRAVGLRASCGWNSRSRAMSSRVVASARCARRLDARGLVRLAEQHAHLGPLEERHRVPGVRGGHPVERVARLGEAPGGEVEHAELEVVARSAWPCGRARCLERRERERASAPRPSPALRGARAPPARAPARVDLLPQRERLRGLALPLADARQAPRPRAGGRATRPPPARAAAPRAPSPSPRA